MIVPRDRGKWGGWCHGMIIPPVMLAISLMYMFNVLGNNNFYELLSSLSSVQILFALYAFLCKHLNIMWYQKSEKYVCVMLDRRKDLRSVHLNLILWFNVLISNDTFVHVILKSLACSCVDIYITDITVPLLFSCFNFWR